MKILDSALTILAEGFIYIVVPVGLIWGWVRWSRRPYPRNLPSILSLIGFTLATASALWAFSSLLYAHEIGGFLYGDPRLYRIYRCGTLLSLSGVVASVGGLWRPSSLRWFASVCSLGTFLFWYAAAMSE